MAKISTKISDAVDLLKQGEVVGLPTETVYGLAAVINNEQAIRQIFTIKERPLFDPLIIHIANKQDTLNIFKNWNETAEIMSQAFWPGALTIILEKQEHINPLITAGLNTVAVRLPRHKAAQKIISEVGIPLAAPSANKFGRTSPNSAEHVLNEFIDNDLLIIDGGNCEVGIESTIIAPLDTGGKSEIFIYRPGMITKEMIEEEFKRIRRAVTVQYKASGIEEKSKISPGTLENHYMPKKPLILFDTDSKVTAWQNKNPQIKFEILNLDDTPQIIARKLYSELRYLEELNIDYIIARLPRNHDSDTFRAIKDRLLKAAKFKNIE